MFFSSTSAKVSYKMLVWITVSAQGEQPFSSDIHIHMFPLYFFHFARKTSNQMCKNVKVFVERLFALGWQKRQIGCLRLELKRCRNAFVLAHPDKWFKHHNWMTIRRGGWASNLVPIDLWFIFLKKNTEYLKICFKILWLRWSGRLAGKALWLYGRSFRKLWLHLHTHTNIPWNIFICTHTQIFHLHLHKYSLKCLKILFLSTALDKNKIWWIYRKRKRTKHGRTTKHDANDRTSKNIH